ncbi:hypothetical protein ES332_A05G064200v1 [Gossypium tomentosum]|uniref:Uncharacterized protein n=1 Tax=Gossypium tomentosum TaxID=34277 RepID=A0A5D2QBK6_GOSTO|nr:hypothetical protein ES332_A05G064200v1 [Gossypium tomentosum]
MPWKRIYAKNMRIVGAIAYDLYDPWDSSTRDVKSIIAFSNSILSSWPSSIVIFIFTVKATVIILLFYFTVKLSAFSALTPFLYKKKIWCNRDGFFT